jgi:hypothetical protein
MISLSCCPPWPHEQERPDPPPGRPAPTPRPGARPAPRWPSFLIAHSPAFFRSRGASSVYALTPETWRCLLAFPGVEPIGRSRRVGSSGVTVFGFSPSSATRFSTFPFPKGEAPPQPALGESSPPSRPGRSLLIQGGGVRDGDSVAQSKEQYRAGKLPFRCLKQVYDAERFAALCRSSSGSIPPSGAGISRPVELLEQPDRCSPSRPATTTRSMPSRTMLMRPQSCIVSVPQVDPAATLLYIACGTGRHLEHLRRHYRWRGSTSIPSFWTLPGRAAPTCRCTPRAPVRRGGLPVQLDGLR